MRDLMNLLSVVPAFGNGAKITATVHSSGVDVTSLNDGNDGVMFVVDIGTVTDGTHTISLEDSIDGGSTWQTVAAPYLQTPSGQSNVITSSTSVTSIKLGYLGNPNVGNLANSTLLGSAPAQKVLVRISNTVTGSPASGAYLSAIAILGYPFTMPAA